ncbi:hypothetical protein [Acinetobacter guillouiae]|uniref:hypothetical protein n=1 Tax=Acinetobacter guillouiae TaxID=106649 RepID=UPI0026E20F4E|nr:hypothetical protein [Acinetobacter guillouiae]MDO6643658.1 hypothetical protein [Acinetobacter guillouiae]
MENNSDIISNDNGVKILQQFEEIKFHLNKYIDAVVGTAEDIKLLDDPLKRTISDILKSFLVVKIPEYESIVKNNIELFVNNDFAEILLNDLNSLRSIIIYDNSDKSLNILEKIKSFIVGFENIRLSIISLQNANNLIRNELQPAIEDVKEKVKDFESVRLALEQRETSSIYLDLHNKYKDEFGQNNFYFFGTLIIAVTITFLTSIKINSLNAFFTTELNYWVFFITIKVLILSITITLCTLFLRRASHAKKLHEQAYQTHVEINAFPIHVRSLKEEDKYELIKELALKYFGKELDQTQNDKIGDLMQNQVYSSTELIKASAEMLKAKGGSTQPQ